MLVYLLWHTRETNAGEDDDKLIGVYSTRRKANEARRRARKLPGFRDTANGFFISKNQLDEDQWTEGYVTVKYSEG